MLDDGVGTVHELGHLETGRRPTVPHAATTDRPRRTRLLIALGLLAAALVGVIGLQATPSFATAAAPCVADAETGCIGGTLQNSAGPVEGVTITVSDDDGFEEDDHDRRQRHLVRGHHRPDALHGRARRVVAAEDGRAGRHGREPGRAARRRRRVLDRRLQPRPGHDARRWQHRGRELVRLGDGDGHADPAAAAVRARYPVRPDPGPRLGRPLPDLRHHRAVELLARRAGDPGCAADLRVLHPAALADRAVCHRGGDPVRGERLAAGRRASGDRCADARSAWCS